MDSDISSEGYVDVRGSNDNIEEDKFTESTFDIESEIQALQDKVNNIITWTEGNKQALIGKKKLILEKVDKLRETMNKRCDQLRDSITSEVNRVLDQEFKTQASTFHYISDELELKKQHIVSSNPSEETVNLIKKQLEAYSDVLDQAQVTKNGFTCDFQWNKAFLQFKNSGALGSFNVTEEKVDGHPPSEQSLDARTESSSSSFLKLGQYKLLSRKLCSHPYISNSVPRRRPIYQVQGRKFKSFDRFQLI